MLLAPGSRVGPYEIVSPLGAGGMGEVYRARDPRLGRDVAIKALPEGFSRDPERLLRFEREARLLASLAHPNIAGLLGLEESGSDRYLVLELVEGESLAQRLARAPIAVDEALEIAAQVAAGVEAAHEAGVIHRDLKPANIMLGADGVAKVLDFGLARGPEGASSPSDSSNSPTFTSPATIAGVILGTAAYMSPEQARGRRVDRRTDIWSFGCVLYEMLARRQAFGGDTVSDLIARVLEREPDWSALPAATPPRVRELLRRCLEKDARQRLRDIGEARVLLARPGVPDGAPPAARAARGAWLPALLAALLFVASGVLLWRARGGGPAVAAHLALVRTRSSPFERMEDAEISPDGRSVVFIGQTAQGRTQLYLRPLEADEPRALEGTDGAFDPFWSPDGRNIGFFANGRLKRVSVGGGPPRVLAEAPAPHGGSWGSKGTIVFAATDGSGISGVPESGGAVKLVAARAPTDEACRWPAFLPDGRHFVYLGDARRTEDHWLRVGDTGGGHPRDLLASAVTNPRFAAPDWLFYVRGGDLLAQRLDPRALRLEGEPIQVAKSIARLRDNHEFEFSVSPAGTITWRSVSPLSLLAWFDRDGRKLSDAGPPARYSDVRLAPDGHSIAYATHDADGRPDDVWTLDPVRGIATRLTPDPESDYSPVWSPDGRRVAYGSYRVEGGAVFITSVSGVSGDSLLPQTKRLDAELMDWSPDGRSILAVSFGDSTRQDLVAVPLQPPGPWRPIAATGADGSWGRFSPDGRRVVFAAGGANESEVFVQDFPEGRRRVQVSAHGGFDPIWCGNGREVVFTAPDGAVMSAVATGADGMDFAAPRELFRSVDLDLKDASRDGQRLLARTPVESAADAQIQLVLDWRAKAKR